MPSAEPKNELFTAVTLLNMSLTIQRIHASSPGRSSSVDGFEYGFYCGGQVLVDLRKVFPHSVGPLLGGSY